MKLLIFLYCLIALFVFISNSESKSDKFSFLNTEQSNTKTVDINHMGTTFSF